MVLQLPQAGLVSQLTTKLKQQAKSRQGLSETTYVGTAMAFYCKALNCSCSCALNQH